MSPDQLGHLGHRLEPAVGGPPEPAGEEPLGRTEVRVVAELAEPFLEGPGPGDLEIAPLEAPEGGSLLRGHVLRADEPEVLRPRQPIIGPLWGPVLGAANLVHRVVDVLGALLPPSFPQREHTATELNCPHDFLKSLLLVFYRFWLILIETSI